ncbi:MAG: DUF4249 domain-containing protein [Lentimicrobiaceae bacterium]|nr:DUF4249 domain-containing protein [Lentimicrobiaceae bacterium]
MKPYYFLLFVCVLFFSCQTEIDVKVPDYYNKIVVEGYIENGEYPIVSLYRSAPYFATMSLEYLMDSVIIKDARVFVKPSGEEEQELFMLPFPRLDYPLFYAYTTQSIVGKFNTSYTLRIEWNNKVYTSQTSISNSFDLDSVRFVPTFGHLTIDSVANMRIWMTDDGKTSNYYQFKVKIHCKDFQDRLWITTIPSAFDNSPFKGISFNYEIMRGAPSTILMPTMDERELRNYLRMNYSVGDTVFLKYGKLDESSYRFWMSANGEITFGQNPFMSPTPIISNIKCNDIKEKCLGVWCGLAKQEEMLILDSTTTKSSGATFRFR